MCDIPSSRGAESVKQTQEIKKISITESVSNKI